MTLEINDRCSYYTKVLDDGRVVDVFPLTGWRARITISRSIEAVEYQHGW